MYAYFQERLPLFYVFLSGIGFSFQALIIKLLNEKTGFHGSFLCVFMRGFVQIIISSIYIYFDERRLEEPRIYLFGNTSYVRIMLFLRSVVGYGGIAFSFLSIELISIGDSTVLQMLSPLLASIISYFLLSEPWRLPELFATIVSLVGATLVAKPPFIFGGSHTETSAFYLGVTYALISCISSALAYICVRILGTTAKMPWANVVFAQAIGQMVLSIPNSYAFGQMIDLRTVTIFQYTMLILGGLIGAISQILMTVGMQREKSAAATAMRMSDVLFGYVWQALFTTDVVSMLSLIGAVLVTSSILIVVIFKKTDQIKDSNNNKNKDVISSKDCENNIELTQLNKLNDSIHNNNDDHSDNNDMISQKQCDTNNKVSLSISNISKSIINAKDLIKKIVVNTNNNTSHSNNNNKYSKLEMIDDDNVTSVNITNDRVDL